MRIFFQGWRRKVGCVVLVMALAFMGAWIRSLLITDFCESPIGSVWQAGFVSHRGHFSYGWTNRKGSTRFKWNSFDSQDPIAIRSHSFFFDFTGGTAPNPSGMPSELIIPYWSIIIPLTLLSACLILWKPRKRV
ncbi:MAG: hypothetical protein JWP89_1870 [Schlesneria sp.]|nr:hypothetical protein [Schlesneria sp.]